MKRSSGTRRAVAESSDGTRGAEVIRALKPVPVDRAAWCRRESVKGGGRDALNGVWE